MFEENILNHPIVLKATLDMYRSCPEDEVDERMNERARLRAVYQNLSLCVRTLVVVYSTAGKWQRAGAKECQRVPR